MTPRDLLGHGALWTLQLLTGLDSRTSALPVDESGRTVDDVARDLAATTHSASAKVRQHPDDVPVEDRDLPAHEAFRLAAADALTAFAECGALNQPVVIDGQVIDGEALCLRVAALHWRTASTLAALIGATSASGHLAPEPSVLAAAHLMLPGLTAILPPVPADAA